MSRRDFEKLQTVLSRNVRRLRRERDWSQEQLAFEAEVDRSYVGQLERGISNPSLLVLWKIAKALDVGVPTLFQVPKG